MHDSAMNASVSRNEFEAVVGRLDAENNRQNHRIDTLEELTKCVQKLAVNMESMVTEQKTQSERLRALEGRDGELWRKAVGYILMAVAGSAVTFLFARLGIV